MELVQLIKIDKNSKISVSTQVLNQMKILLEQGYFEGVNGVLPDYTVFAKQLHITPTAALKVYNGLRKYGHHIENGFVLSKKEYSLRQLRQLMPYVVQSGVSLEEVIAIYTEIM